MVIMINALRERIRKRELYISVTIGTLILLLLGSGSGTLTINGAPITDFKNMFGVMNIVVNTMGCIMGAILSINTIPNEYKRGTSHLVWIRNVSQIRYHFELALANVISAIISTGVLYIGLAIYIIANNQSKLLLYLIPAFMIVCINLIIVSMITSALSIVMPNAVTGLVSLMCVMVGVFHGLLDIYRNIVGGVSAKIIKVFLMIIPDLNEIQRQATGIINRESVNMHVLLKGILAIYVISLMFFIFKKKEA